MRRGVVMGLVIATSGCAGLQLPFPARAPNAVQIGEIGKPSFVEFDMLGNALGKACATREELAELEGPRSVDPATIGNPALYERAKYEAITTTRGADGLVAVAAKAYIEGANMVCVALSGRAYRIRGMRIGGPMRDDAPRSRPSSTDEKLQEDRLITPNDSQ